MISNRLMWLYYWCKKLIYLSRGERIRKRLLTEDISEEEALKITAEVNLLHTKIRKVNKKLKI